MNRLLSSILVLAAVGSTAPYDVTLSEEPFYLNSAWGKAYVLKNSICSLSVMPKVGGRVMSYCLGAHSFLRVDASAGPGPYGSALTDLFNGGGFIAWPVPQVNWYTPPKSWPPPGYISHGNYSDVVVNNSADSVVLALTSPQEQLTSAADLVLRKVYTVYRATSRVKVDIRLINKKTTPQTWSIREVAQAWPSHSGKSDYSNFRAYFPKGTSTLDGARGYWSTAGETDPGNAALYSQFSLVNNGKIVKFRYDKKPGRIGVRPSDQWLAYQDSSEGYTFIQKGALDASATYPEYGGAVLIVYMGDWLEMELCAPQKGIPANDSLQFVANWYSTKLAGDILGINNAGAIKDSITVEPVSGAITGTYGVFYQGTVKIWLDGQAAAAKELPVSPMTTLSLNETVTIPPTSHIVSLLLYNAAGALVDTLDSKVFRTVNTRTTLTEAKKRSLVRICGRSIFVNGTGNDPIRIRLYTLKGKMVTNAVCAADARKPIDLSGFSQGSYLLKVEMRQDRYSRMIQIVGQ
jgi:hypothetical protein